MILKVENLSFKYRKEFILKDINFHVLKNELVAVMGPNGVGKTTMLRCINSILQPDRGRIVLDGEDIARMNLNEIARVISYVPQKIEQNRMTAFDSILLGRKPHITWNITSEDIRKTDAVINNLGLSQLTVRYIDEMSGGELQKVSIARALVQEPKLLLLDEPTSSLDLKNQLDILDFISHVVHGHNMTALMTMHNINTALRYADRCIFLKDGKVHNNIPTGEITPEIIHDVYGVKVKIDFHQENPYIIPIV